MVYKSKLKFIHNKTKNITKKIKGGAHLEKLLRLRELEEKREKEKKEMKRTGFLHRQGLQPKTGLNEMKTLEVQKENRKKLFEKGKK